jgi:hypothetical protein
VSSLKDKILLLEKSGYKFIFDRDIYCNPRDRKCFSLEFVEDNPIEKIKKKCRNRKGNLAWFFILINHHLPLFEQNFKTNF